MTSQKSLNALQRKQFPDSPVCLQEANTGHKVGMELGKAGTELLCMEWMFWKLVQSALQAILS